MSNKDLTLEERVALIEAGHLFDWATFFVGIVAKIQKMVLSKEMLVFLVTTAMFMRKGSMADNVQWISYLVVCVIFILSESLRTLIGKNTTMSIEGKFGASISKEIKDGNKSQTTDSGRN